MKVRATNFNADSGIMLATMLNVKKSACINRLRKILYPHS